MGHFIIGLGPSGRSILSIVQRRINGQPLALKPNEKVIFADEHDILENVIHKQVCNVAVTQNEDLSFHICLGVDDAIGTDVLFTTIRQIHQSMAAYHSLAFGVYLYLYVPDALGSVNICNFYRKNGYSILQKINAATLNRTLETETGVTTEFIEDCMREPLRRVYLFSDINESDRFFFGSGFTTAASEFLTTRITGSIMCEGFIGERLECGRPPESDANGTIVNSRMFSTFGIKRIIYPESEIRDYAVMSCLAVTVRQLLYNNWIENYGFVFMTDEEAEAGYAHADVLHPCRLERFMIDDFHLTLQVSFEGFCESEKWEKFPVYWGLFCDCKSKEIMEDEKDKHRWVQLLDEACKAEFDSRFRSSGVRQFYADMREHDALSTLSRIICGNIESILFHEWMSDMGSTVYTVSLQKIRITLNWLIDYVSNSIVKYRDGQLALQKEREASSYERDILRQRILKTGWLQNALFGTVEKYYVQYACMMADECVCATKIESYVYAQCLLESILVRLKEIQNSVVCCENYLGHILHEAEISAENIFTYDKNRVIDKVYDPDLLHEVVDHIMLRDREVLDQSGKVILDYLYNKASLSDSVFQDISRILSSGYAIDRLSLCIFKLVEEYLVKIGEYHYSYQLLNVNILEQIMKTYNSDALLDKYIREIVADAGVLLRFDVDECGRIPAGQTYVPMAGCVQLSLPKCYEKAAFRERFIRKIQEQIPSPLFLADRSIIDSHNASEIVITSIKTPFPLRYVQTIRYLKSLSHESGPACQ